MKVINIVGPIDKRMVVYPLLKVIDTLGRVAVVTDDANMRRMSEDYSKVFTKGRSDYLIKEEIEEICNGIRGVMPEDYDYVVVVTTKEIVRDADKIVYCHGLPGAFLEEAEEWKIAGVEMSDVLITGKRAKPAEKDGHYIRVKNANIRYVWDCEEAKDYLPCSVSDIQGLSTKLFSGVLGVDSKEYSKILTRKELT